MLLTRSLLATLTAQISLGCAVLFAGELAHAQTAPTAAPKTSPSLPGRPLWTDLSESQQQALAPLIKLWPTMSEPHKRKWLVISQNFSQLSTDEQTTVQGRMREWAALSPQQRAAARLNYADAKQLLQEDKKAKWEAYQALPPEAKQKLAAQQTQPALGAAPAIKPVPSSKLTTPPVATSNKALPRIASGQADPTTLLPTPASANAAPANPGSESAVIPQ